MALTGKHQEMGKRNGRGNGQPTVFMRPRGIAVAEEFVPCPYPFVFCSRTLYVHAALVI